MKFKLRLPKNKLTNFVVKRKLITGLFLGAVLLTGFFVIQTSNKPQTKTDQVKKATIVQKLSLSGEIDANEKADLSFQTGGLTSWVGVKKGDHVGKYQGIAALDERSARKSLERNLTNYLLQRSEFDQTSEDNLNRTPNQAINNEMKRILERNQWDLELAINSVELQDLVIKLSTISCPIEGVVTDVKTPLPNVNVSPFSTQYTIVNPQSIYFKVGAEQTELADIKIGTEGKITFDAYPDEQVLGKVTNISLTPRTDEAGTVYDIAIEINVDNSNLKYLIGMTGDIEFITYEGKNSLSLPSSFIKTDEKGTYVYIEKNKKSKKYIMVGIEGDDRTEVKELTEGTVVYD